MGVGGGEVEKKAGKRRDGRGRDRQQSGMFLSERDWDIVEGKQSKKGDSGEVVGEV